MSDEEDSSSSSSSSSSSGSKASRQAFGKSSNSSAPDARASEAQCSSIGPSRKRPLSYQEVVHVSDVSLRLSLTTVGKPNMTVEQEAAIQSAWSQISLAARSVMSQPATTSSPDAVSPSTKLGNKVKCIPIVKDTPCSVTGCTKLHEPGKKHGHVYVQDESLLRAWPARWGPTANTCFVCSSHFSSLCKFRKDMKRIAESNSLANSSQIEK